MITVDFEVNPTKEMAGLKYELEISVSDTLSLTSASLIIDTEELPEEE